MVTYPVWPSRTFTRCNGHSSDLDRSSFRSKASLDADGNLRRRLLRVGENISPVRCAELEDAQGIASVMIVLGDDYTRSTCSAFRFLPTVTPATMRTRRLERIPERAAGLTSYCAPWPAHPLRRIAAGRMRGIHSDPQLPNRRGRVLYARP